MGSPPLACTVRDCGLFLERHGRTLRCARHHSYDVARAGYINLLQPQDRKSLAAGDRRETIEARARLLAAGIGRSIVNGIVSRAAQIIAPEHVVGDLGSGSGDLLGLLADRTTATYIGIDLSTAAAEFAARRFPQLTWVVANADRRVPLLDSSVDLVLSVHGRRNPEECARVLVRGGHLIVAVPAPDDLIELRALVLGAGLTRDRAEAVVAEHARHFTILERVTLREQHRLKQDALRDLLRGTYRGKRLTSADKLEGVEALDVTLASEIVVFRRPLVVRNPDVADEHPVIR